MLSIKNKSQVFSGIFLLGIVAGVAALGAGCRKEEPIILEEPGDIPEEYLAQLGDSRSQREERLRSPDGWLALVGLHWLPPGDNPFAAKDDGSGLVFAKDSSTLPPDAEMLGAFRREGSQVSVVAHVEGALAREVSAAEGEGEADGETLENLPVGKAIPLLDDNAEDGPTVLRHGDLSFYVIQREEKVGVRVKCSSAPALTHFEGLDYFPVDLAWKIDARFEPYATPKIVGIPNVLGSVYQEEVTGAVAFEVEGETYRIEPIVEVDGSLFLIFSDATNGTETYGAGRFLYADPPDEKGRVNLDFNSAYNPPCAFSPYATCPLPPKENKLPLRIEAGEKKFGEGH